MRPLGDFPSRKPNVVNQHATRYGRTLINNAGGYLAHVALLYEIGLMKTFDAVCMHTGCSWHFRYHVTNPFAVSSRSGNPEELKASCFTASVLYRPDFLD